MSTIFHRRKRNLKVIWRFDTSSLSITAVYDDQPCNIMYYDCQKVVLMKIPNQKINNYQEIINRTESLARQMSKKFITSFQKQPDTIAIVFGEPWSHIFVRHIRHKRKTSFKLTKNFLKDLIHRDIKTIPLKNKHQLPAIYGISEPSYQDVRVAGHRVQNFLGQQVSDVSLSYLSGEMNNSIQDRLLTVFSEYFHTEKRKITTYHFQDILSRFFVTTKHLNGCCIDISGLVTDIYLFNNGSLQQWGTIPFGHVSMVHQLAEKMHMNTFEFTTFMKMYTTDRLLEKTRTQLEKLFETAIKDWKTDMETFLHHAVAQGSIIDTVFWVGDSNDFLMPLFVKTLQSQKIAYPVIFGTHDVGNQYIQTILAAHEYHENFDHNKLQDQDRIIISILGKD